MDMRQLRAMSVLDVPASSVDRALRAMAGQYMAQQRGRIKLAQTPSGRPFREYSEEYREKKARAGRKTQPDLRVSGHMLRSQKVQVRRGSRGAMSMRIEFDGTRPSYYFAQAAGRRSAGGSMVMRQSRGRMRSNASIAYHVDRLRPFIGVSAREARALAKLFFRRLKRDADRRARSPRSGARR
jgi:hypothetical protein